MLTFSKIGEGFSSEVQLPGIGRVYKYLRDRGVEREDVDRLGIKIELAKNLMGRADNRAAIIFPHIDLVGKTQDWWSARLVELEDRPRIITSFAQLTAPKGKMYCPPKEPPAAYLPPILRWGEYQRGDTIYIHESCIKAINGAKLGRWSIGLNGVWGWMSTKHNIALVRELKEIPWKALDLKCCIVFDSNAADNAQVQSAISALAAKINSICGVRPTHRLLPKNPNGEHWGFDDFCVQMGADEAKAYLDGPETLVDIGEAELLKVKLNSEVCVVRSLGRIAEQETGTLMSRGTFTDVNYAHYVTYDDKDRQVSAARSWLSDARRTEVEGIVYEPGQGRITKGNLNLWQGMGCDPMEGDVSLWLELLANNVPDEKMRHWLISWMAYPLQNPGKKMNTSVLVFGPSGTGKDMIFGPLHRIYGDRNAVMISNDELRTSFTSLYATRQFVHANELVKARGEEDAISQRIKMIVTAEKMTVNRKGDPEYKVRNTINIALTSNYVDCVKLDEDDRRLAVIEWKPASADVDFRGNQPYWIKLVNWRDSEEGPSALYHYLLEYDIGDFDPGAWAPNSEAKEEVKESGISALERWARRIANNPDEELPELSMGKALWSGKELAQLYYDNKSGDEISKRMVDDVVMALRSKGLQRANEGKPIRVGDRTDRYWVLRRKDEDWANSTKCSQHLKPKV